MSKQRLSNALSCPTPSSLARRPGVPNKWEPVMQSLWSIEVRGSKSMIAAMLGLESRIAPSCGKSGTVVPAPDKRSFCSCRRGGEWE